MATRRRRFTAAFRKRVALEALRGGLRRKSGLLTAFAVVSAVFSPIRIGWAAESPPAVLVQCAEAAAAWWLGREGVAFEKIVPDRAVARCEAATRAVPDEGDGWAYLARAYRKAGRYGDALAAGDRAIERGSVEGLWERGVALYFGRDIDKNPVEASEWYRRAAERGHAVARNNLGWLYYKGEGVERDVAEAVRWWREAAEQGHSDAQFKLGTSYYRGEGVEQDVAEAVRWIREAAEQHHMLAQTFLGGLLHIGEGIERDHVEAVRWIREAAEQGGVEARVALGDSYYRGEGLGLDCVFRASSSCSAPSASTESRFCGGTGPDWCSHRSVWIRAGSPGRRFATE